MHIKHKAGDKMFVDYAGQKLGYFDRQSGEADPVEVFVAVLGASGLTYAEASESQEKEQWIRSNERAILVFWVVPLLQSCRTTCAVPSAVLTAMSRRSTPSLRSSPNTTTR